MADPVSVGLSCLALAVSGTALWLTSFRRGQLKMTTPTLVFFGYEGNMQPVAKVFFRALLYSTAARGQVIEGMYVRLGHQSAERRFGFWMHGETKNLVIGSGLFVGQEGLGANHHFVLSRDEPMYEFRSGQYTVQTFARSVGKHAAQKLAEISISVTNQEAAALSGRAGVMFRLNPDSGRYIGEIDGRQ
jgi:hypothetical protein